MNRVRPSNERLVGIEPYDAKNYPAQVFQSHNENPLDVAPAIKQEMLQRIGELSFNRYPDPMAKSLRAIIAEGFGVAPENILLGNGGDEHLFNIFLAYGGPGRKCLVMPPAFSVYAYNAHLTDTEVVEVPLKPDFTIDEEAVLSRVSQGDIDILIITSPNNPTGGVVRMEFLQQVLQASDTLVFMDEAYGEFWGDTSLPLLADNPNLLILHTFSKAFALAGVRLGYLIGSTEVIDEFTKVRQPYSVDAVSQVIGQVAFEHREECRILVEAICKERPVLAHALAKICGVEVFPSQANFMLIRVPDAHRVWERLYDEHSVLLRDFSSTKYLENCLRVTVGTPEENSKLVAALRAVLS